MYTRLFTNYTGTGFYSVGIVASNDDGGAKVMTAAAESKSPVFINLTDDGQIVSNLSIGMEMGRMFWTSYTYLA